VLAGLPNAINDRGQVVGTILQPDGSSHGFIWTKTYGIKDLGTLGGPNSTPLAINPAGTVVGFSDTADGVLRAFVWTRATAMQDLGTLAGDTHSWALAIDGNGRVVGSSWHPGVSQGRPFTWTQSGGMQELGPFDQKNIQSADGVNKAGELLLSRYNNGGYTSFLLTPIMHTALNVSPNPAHIGETVTLTATVNSAVHPPPPNGEVVNFFYGGNTLLGKATLHAGVATLTTTFTTSRLLTAVYVGDSNYASSKSLAVKEVIVK
jgi:probable HAF family extracellular repeat protein